VEPTDAIQNGQPDAAVVHSRSVLMIKRMYLVYMSKRVLFYPPRRPAETFPHGFSSYGVLNNYRFPGIRA